MMHFYRESQFYIEVVQKKLMVWGVGGRRDNKQMLGILFLHEKNTIYDYHFISVEKLPIAVLSPLSNFFKKYMRCTPWTLMIENINKYCFEQSDQQNYSSQHFFSAIKCLWN